MVVLFLKHIGAVEEPNICMDEWYVLLSENSQDAGVGDPFFDPGGIYPNGTITLEPTQNMSFMYQGSENSLMGIVWNSHKAPFLPINGNLLVLEFQSPYCR